MERNIAIQILYCDILLINKYLRGIMSDIIQGFEPVFAKNSRVLILGSFPSVKSRQIDFYYGHKQNRFWKMLCGYFGEEVPDATPAKIAFLKKHEIALWDIVQRCEIVGSSDSKIKNYTIADLALLYECPLRGILLNGTTAYRIFCEQYGDLKIPYYLLPSTSPANVRYSEQRWIEVLNLFFTEERK